MIKVGEVNGWVREALPRDQMRRIVAYVGDERVVLLHTHRHCRCLSHQLLLILKMSPILYCT